jgi:hypothetical protein
MNEMDLLIRMRAEVPLAPPPGAVEATVLTGVASDPPARRGRRGRRAQWKRRAQSTRWTQWSRRQRLIAAWAAFATVAAAGAVTVYTSGGQVRYARPQVLAWTGRPAAPLPALGLPSVGRARTGPQLVEFVARAAALAPARAPGPHEWVYMKIEVADSSKGGGGFLFGPPDEREFSLSWVRVDWGEYAGTQSFPIGLPPQTVVHTHISISPVGGSLGGWKSVSYAYLNSLPTDPARLRAVILGQNGQRMPWYQPNPDVAVFSAIATLLVGQTEGVWLPPRLAVTIYRLLQQIPGVHFDSAADLAGRTGLGFYMVIDGWQKHELVINPVTYSYMGDEWIAVRAHTSVATDGTRYIKKGQVLGWAALLASAIVKHAGQIP